MKIITSVILVLSLGIAVHCGEKNDDDSLVLGALALAMGGTSSGATSANSGTGDSTDDSTSPTVATPTFSPAEGNQTSNANISISTTTTGATIYYTTDGTDPTTSSTQYSAPIANIWSLAGKTIQAIAVKSGSTNSAILSGVFSLPPLKTGSGAIGGYTLVANEDDRTLGINRGYNDNSDGTVTDTATGLVWQKCTKGSNSATDCSGVGTGDRTNWADARAYCSGLSLASRTWRLPTRQEFETLPDYSRSSPAIDTTAFPATVANNYWSSTTYAPITSDAWVVGFGAGNVSGASKASNNYVRCVSGSAKEYSANLTDNSDGTVKDNATGLIWQKCSQGQNNDEGCTGSATTANWSGALTYCSGLSLAGRTWRLPTGNELKTIVDTTKSSGATIDTTAFPATVADIYWSSTTYAPDTTLAWLVSFNGGYVLLNGKAGNEYVRCVSGP